MNRAQTLLFVLIVFFFSSCNNKSYEYWDTENFNVTEDALKNGEKIRLIYASGGPEENEGGQYYYHYVVESKETGDTINILTTTYPGVQKIRKHQGNIRYISMQYDIANFIGNLDSDISELSKLIKDSESFDIKINISRVARDPEFDDIAKNDHPAIIGFIGIKKPGEDAWEIL